MKGKRCLLIFVQKAKKGHLITGIALLLSFALYQTIISFNQIKKTALTEKTIHPLKRTLAQTELPPELIGYSDSAFSLVYEQHFNSGPPTVQKGKPEQFYIHPALPMGLFLDGKTGVISGAPKRFNERRLLFTVEAVNRKGISKIQISLNPIRAEKPKVKFQRTTLVLRIGEPIDIGIESTGGPYQTLQLYPENELPKGIYFDKKQGRLFGKLENAAGFSFENPTRVYFLRSKGFRSISESSVHITVIIPETDENQNYKGRCLNAELLLKQFKHSGKENDALSETWVQIGSGDYRIPSPRFLSELESKMNKSSRTGNKRFIKRQEWLERFGYEISQNDCQSALIRRHAGESWTLYAIDSFHSGKIETATHTYKQKVVFKKKQTNSTLPDRIDLTRITDKPSDIKKDVKDYLEVSEWVYDPSSRVSHRCDDEVRHENQRIQFTRTLQLGIIPSRKTSKVYADGGPAQNPAWSLHIKQIAESNPDFSCKFVD